MAYYAYKQVRDLLPESELKTWDGEAGYDSNLWSIAAKRMRKMRADILHTIEMGAGSSEEAETLAARLQDEYPELRRFKTCGACAGKGWILDYSPMVASECTECHGEGVVQTDHAKPA